MSRQDFFVSDLYKFVLLLLFVLCVAQQQQPPPITISTLVGSGMCSNGGENTNAPQTNINFPFGLFAMLQPGQQGQQGQDNGFLVYADTLNHRIRSLNFSTMIVKTEVGSGIPGYSGDNGPVNNAKLNLPTGLTLDNNLLYIADTNNHVVRVVDITSNVITTFAGNGTAGYSGDGGDRLSAQLNRPIRVQVHPMSNTVFIVDEGNARIRAVNRNTNIISTLVGNGTNVYSGDDGPYASATLNNPFDIAIDNMRNMLYIAERNGSRIRAVNFTSGTISTIAGTGSNEYSGDGGQAKLATFSPILAIALDIGKNVLFVSESAGVIRAINFTSNIVVKFAGTGFLGFGGDGGNPFAANISKAHALFFEPLKNLLVVSDSENCRIRIIGDVCNGCNGTNANQNCFGIPANNFQVCSGHGMCIAKDNCTCVQGYRGKACQTEIAPFPNYVAHFNGGNYFLVQNDTLLGLTNGNFSYEFWANVKTTAGEQTFLGMNSAFVWHTGGSTFDISAEARTSVSSWVGFQGTIDGGKSKYVTKANAWDHHVVNFVKKPGNLLDISHIVNGKIFISTSNINAMYSSLANDLRFAIGKWYVATFGDRYLNGYLSEVRIYNRSFTLEEVQTKMCGFQPFDDPLLVSYWKFDNSSQDLQVQHRFDAIIDSEASAPSFVNISSVDASQGSMAQVCGGCPVNTTGPNCEYPVCFGRPSFSPDVCSGHGICARPNQCTCSPGFGGPSCTCTSCGTGVCLGSAVFDGISSRLSSSQSTDLSFPNFTPYTITVWAYPTGSTGVTALFSKHNYGNDGEYQALINLSLKLFTVTRNAAPWNVASATNAFTLNSWHFFAITFDGTNMTGYINGTLVATGSFASVGAANAKFTIGASMSGASHTDYFQGFISEVAAYNRSLSSSELIGKMNAPGNTADPNLVAYFDFTEMQYSQYSMAFDQTGKISSLMNINTNFSYFARYPCKCPPGTAFPTCTPHSCFGQSSFSNNTCNGHGNCIGNDVCACFGGFFGPQCFDFTCFGTNSSSPAVCTGHGDCFALNACNCTGNWTGSMCNIPFCFNIPNNNASVCSGHGTCVNVDNCNCVGGWVGSKCEVPICFGKNASNPTVCSSNGICTSPNNCTCFQGIDGQQCNNFACFGINSTLPSVCSGHGFCAAPNMCSCAPDFVGLNCSVPLCFNQNATDPMACSGHGNCVSVNNCSCTVGWNGPKCDIHSCYGISSTEPTVCNGRGFCVATDICNCIDSYSGNSCQNSVCFGKSSIDPQVCSNHGTCTPPLFTRLFYRPYGFGSNLTRFTDLPSFGNTNFDIVTSYIHSTSTNFGIHWAYDRSGETSVQFRLENQPSNKLAFFASNVGNTDSNQFTTGPILTLDQWYILRIERRGKIVSLFVNDTFQMSSAQSASVYPMASVVGDRPFFTIGGRYANGVGANIEQGTLLQGSIGFMQITIDPISMVPRCSCNGGYTGNNCSQAICFGISDSSACSSHGLCSAPDTCSCSIGYVGNQCQLPVCFGKNSSAVGVCSSHGVCNDPDLCSCQAGWNGVQCDVPICYSLNATDPRVCNNKNGTCVAPDNCICNMDYIGAQCTTPVCYGIAANSSLVCNQLNGTCVKNNTCVCNAGFVGFTCSLPICYGKNSSNPTVCSGHGNCFKPNTCNCGLGYTDLQCQTPLCYGLNATDPRVCNNNNGTCLGPDNCVCNVDYEGTQCQTPVCYGHPANSPMVCNNQNGTCVRNNTCICNAGYTGITCVLPLCNGKNSSDPTVCSGHGICQAPNMCICNLNYAGNNCQDAVCFGTRANNSTVCSSHGTCVSPNTCNCAQGYTDVNCQTPICFGLNATNPQVCSGNGTCISHNNCSCITGFTFGSCQLPLCFGKNSSEQDVCSGKGFCNGPNTCVCSAGYFSPNCSQYNCYGTSFSNSLVCSSRGQCIEPDSCNCSIGTTGLQCEMNICNGKNSTDSTVCSGHGSCSAPQTCTCNSGYVGQTCSLAVCNGRNSSDPLVCSGHGICSSPNICDCSNHTGPLCQHPMCFGIGADSSSVCSSHGVCFSQNNCTCAFGFTGQQCELNICFGKNQTDPDVCSSRGNCTGPNLCQCKSGFTGQNCQMPICFGLNASNPQVCSSNGSCIAPDTCSCSAGFAQGVCNIPICFGINSTSPQVCSGKGFCNAPNSCICQPGYYSPSCSQYDCGGINYNNSAVCSGHGSCSAPNTCVCNAGFVGPACNSVLCNGLNHTNPNVCSSHGSCVQPDTCNCFGGWSGTICSVPICSGINASSPLACSGNGTCIFPNNCSCFAGYVGARCELPVCFGLPSSNPSVCTNKNGDCVLPDTCICKTGYVGANCAVPLCYGLNATNPLVCSGNGSCIAPDQCACRSNFTQGTCSQPMCFGRNQSDPQVCSGNGFCNTPNSCLCNGGYFGANCELFGCFALSSSNPSVCSGHGSCIAPNNCSCSANYIGAKCETPICFGFPANHSQVCSGNGLCVAAQQCTCRPNFYGIQCEISSCGNILSNSSAVCNRNGTCVNLNSCVCNANYTGPNCEIPICNGIPANAGACSGHGTCVRSNTCSCNNGWQGPTCSSFNCDKLNNCFGNGVCIGPNLCNCTSGDWTSSNCSVPICYGVSSLNPLVCSGSGACVSKHLCLCKPGYVGSRCQFAICNNVNASSPSACSGHGTCTAPETCTCSPGYSGPTCSLTSCFGTLSTSFTVCNQRGSCVGPDSCACNTGFSGFACQTPTCNGISGDSAIVCSRRGNCTAPNTCSCSQGYSGTNCETIDTTQLVCFGRSAIDPQVCSAKGRCVANNNCSCIPGYTGQQCQSAVCFGKSSSSFDVCSGAGFCQSPDTCVCKDGYSGSQCNQLSCFGDLSTSASVCSGNGKCVLPDRCLCNSGYVGKCDTPTCFALNSTDSRVCSGNGRCVAPNQCTCNAGYTGPQCNTVLCFGQPSTFEGTCSRRGRCFVPNVCTCLPGFSGEQCQIPSCFGISATDPNVCGGKGVCVANNTCICNQTSETGFWNGNSQCTTCSRDYSGPFCNVKRCDGEITCNNHGTCSPLFTCNCFRDNVRGFYNGTFCDKCVSNYFGPQCLANCDANVKCNGRGICTESATCQCFNSDETGRFVGSACESCAEGWYGSKCSAFVSPNFVFSPNGDRLLGTLRIRTIDYSAITVDCRALLAPFSLSRLGVNPTCWWPRRQSNPADFEIIFGSSPSILPGESIILNIRFFENATTPITILTSAASETVEPVATVTAPPTISVCDGVTLDGSLSSSRDRRQLRYRYRAIDGIRVTIINEFLATQSGKTAFVPSALLDAGNTYTFGLQVTNYLNVASREVTINVTKSGDAVPVASIRGPPSQTTFINDFFKLEGNALISDCFYTNKEILYSWRQTSGAKVEPRGTQTRTLLFAPFTFPKFGEAAVYTFELTVRPVANPILFTTASVSITALPQAVVAVIRGGNRVESTQTAFVLDASSSFDPDQVSNSNETFSWSCLTKDGAFCVFANQFTLPSTAQVTIPQFILSPGDFIFTVLYSKGSRSSSTSCTITIVPGIPPRVSIITNLPSKINRDERIAIQGVASIAPNLNVALLSYNWRVFTAANVEIRLKSSDLFTSTNGPNLAIRPNVLTSGETYTFTLFATYGDQQGFASTAPTTVNQAPQPGVFSVEPVSGTAAQTEYTLTMSQWIDEDTPLRYSFAYYQGSQLITLALLSTSNKVSLTLPSGSASTNFSLTLSAKVVDSYGAITEALAIVQVLPPSRNSTQLLQLATASSQASLSTAIANSDFEKVNQVVSSVAQLINIPTSTSPSQPGNICPNQCSGKGTCVAESCVCDKGWTTLDCSLTEEELLNRQALRAQLLTTLVSSANASKNQEPITTESLNQQAAIVSQITSKPEELTSESKQLAVNFMAALVSNALSTPDESKGEKAIIVDESIASTVASALSNVAETAFTPSSIVQEDARQLASSITNTVSSLSSAVLSNKLPGETAIQITQPSISIAVQKEFANKLNNLGVSIQQYDKNAPAATVLLPSINIINQQKRAATESVNIQAVTYTGNPYAFSDASNNISSSVLSFSLKNDRNVEIPVTNLASPIFLTIPGQFNLSTLTVGCLLTTSNVPSCRYWDATQEKWSTAGCAISGIANDYIVCACNHLTDFAGFIESLRPEMNLLTPEDFIARVNTDNLTTLIVVLSLAGSYVLLMAIAYLADWILQPKNEAERKLQRELVFMGKWRMIIEAIRREHIWVSLISRPALLKSYTRPQRLTVIYLILLSNFVINALFFGTNQPTPLKTVSASIISQLASIPFVFVIAQLFIYTRTDRQRKIAVKTIPADMVNDVGDFELNEMKKKNFTPESLVQLYKVPLENILSRKAELQQLIPRAIEKMMYYIDNYPDKAGLFRVPGVKSKIDELKNKLDEGEDVNFSQFGINDVCGAFKLWLTELPEPILTFKRFEAFMECMQIKDTKEKINVITKLINSLPAANYAVLKYIMQISANLVEHKSQTSSGMAIVIAMPLARPQHEDEEVLVKTAPAIIALVELMIKNYTAIFLSNTDAEIEDATPNATTMQTTSNSITAVVKDKNQQLQKLQNRLADRKEKRKSLTRMSVNSESMKMQLATMQLSKMMDVGDNILDRAEFAIHESVRLRAFSPLLLFVLLLVALVYFGIIAVALLIMELVFYRSWYRYLTSLVVCLSFVIPIGGVMYLYFMQKREIFRLQRRWDISVPSLVFAGIMAFIFFVFAIIAVAIASGLQFWTLHYGIEHTAIIAGCLLLLSFMCISFIILTVMKPKIQTQEVKPPSEEPLPWWCIFIWYPICWAVLAVLSWVIVTYGTKFGQQKANAWMLACLLGVGQSVFLTGPTSVFLKTVFLSMLVNSMNFAFFSLSAVQITTALDDAQAQQQQ